MIALMVRAQELGTSADWLIWWTHDRALPEGAKLWVCPSEGEPLGETVFTMGSRRGWRRAKCASTCGCSESSCQQAWGKA